MSVTRVLQKLTDFVVYGEYIIIQQKDQPCCCEVARDAHSLDDLYLRIYYDLVLIVDVIHIGEVDLIRGGGSSAGPCSALLLQSNKDVRD